MRILLLLALATAAATAPSTPAPVRGRRIRVRLADGRTVESVITEADYQRLRDEGDIAEPSTPAVVDASSACSIDPSTTPGEL